MANDLINTLEYGERVTSTYAEIYFEDDYCDFTKSITELQPEIARQPSNEGTILNEWKSPSDLLIGILELKPPFTSKITRGITHEGILAIGDGVLEAEQAKFLARVNELVNDNNEAWEFILDYEKKKIADKVKEIYDKIFRDKSRIMIEECTKFYEKSLQDLENHLRSEIKAVLIGIHSEVISDLNVETKSSLQKEKFILNDILLKKYHLERRKIKKYYKRLLKNEANRNAKLYNHALHERNDALQAFVRQAEAETTTSTMYVMCAERKKCKINQFIVENYQTLEISEKIKKIKEKQGVIDDLKQRDARFSYINKEWEDKIRKIMQLFLKFISFSLKLLPEQTTFLLDLEKMVILQLNELQKTPSKAPSILVEENVFRFEQLEKPETPCTKDPFEIVGDTADSIPTRYGSTETLPSDVDLPFIRVQRQYIYAKCHKFEEVKAFLESQKCKCTPKPEEKATEVSSNSVTQSLPLNQEPSQPSNASSYERILLDDFGRTNQCLAKQCQDWSKRFSFPYLDSYLDYTEENFQRLKVIIGKKQKKEPKPDVFSAKDIVYRQVPYAETKEPYHNVGTQYSSQEDLDQIFKCDCASDTKNTNVNPDMSHKLITDMLTKRKISLRRLMQTHPRLLKVFTDESFDFCL